MPGLVEILDVASDTRESLIHVINVLLAWDRTVTHYRTGKDVFGNPYLIMMWSDSNGRGQPLIAPMDDASAIADQIYAWLRTQDYSREPDHDGSNNKGWRIKNTGPTITNEKNTWASTDSTPYDVLCVQPYWIEYGK